MKTCPSCKECLTENNFGKDSAKKDGLKYWCNECAKNYSRKYTKTEKSKTSVREYCQKNKERRALYARNFRKNNPEKSKRFSKNQRQKYPEKAIARHAISHALSTGKIERKPCQYCGNINSEAHHGDYSKPLKVIWLCKKHHAAIHRKVTALA